MTTQFKLDYPNHIDDRIPIEKEAEKALLTRYPMISYREYYGEEEEKYEEGEIPDHDRIDRYIAWWSEKNGVSYSSFAVFHESKVSIDINAFIMGIHDDKLLQFAVDLGVVIPGLTYSVKEITAYVPEPQYEQYRLNYFDEAYKEILTNPANAVSGAFTVLESICQQIAKDRGQKVGNEKITDLLKKFINDDDFFIEPEIAKQSKDMIKEMCKMVKDTRNKNTKAHNSGEPTIEDPIHASFIINTVATVGLFLLQNHHKSKSQTSEPIF